jgi:hypothetical protein
MKIELEISDEFVAALAEALAEKIGTKTSESADDDFGSEAEAEAEVPAVPSLEDMQSAIREAIGKHTKEKVKACVKKISGAEKVADIPEEKRQAVLDALKKIK